MFTPSAFIRGIVATLIVAVGTTAYAGEPLDVVRSAVLWQQLQAALAAKGPDYKPRTEHLHADGSPL